MAEQTEPLSYAVRGKVIAKYFGQLCVVLAVLAAVPLIASLIFGEYALGPRHAVVVTLLGAAGALLRNVSAPANIQRNEAFVITGFIFLCSSLVWAWCLQPGGLSWSSAFFEAVSAVTTTGLSTLSAVEQMPRTFLFTRAWAQWSGGLGIVVFTVALLLRPGMEAKRLAGIEETPDLVGGTRHYAVRVMMVYSAITVSGVLLLMALGASPFSALLHTLSAVSTGGFSTFDGSLLGFEGWAVRTAVSVLGLIGAVSLPLYYLAVRQGRRKITESAEVRALLVAVLAVSGLLAVFWRAGGMSWSEIAANAPLMAVSAQTTTGFSTFDPAVLGEASKLVLMVSMAAGGCIGSTAGGVKLFRVIVLLTTTALVLRRTRLPDHAVVEARIGGQRLEAEEIAGAYHVVLLYVLMIVLSWLPFLAWGYDALGSLFEVVSATTTTGLSAGIASPNLPDPLRAVLCLDMLLGRLEIVAILVFLYPGTWWGRRRVAT